MRNAESRRSAAKWGAYLLPVAVLFLALLSAFSLPRPEYVSQKNRTQPSDSMVWIQDRYLLNINAASVSELEQLPGIGPALAQAIVEYREETGGFSCPEELDHVRGIGSGKLSNILDRVCAVP